nr:uncharacterized protein LOC128702125 [Cherax quadricarinatus]
MTRAVVGVLLMAVASLAATTTLELQQEDNNDTGGEAKFFVKNYYTTTWTFLSSFTSTVPYTCYTTGMEAPMACMGRRLRRQKRTHMQVSQEEAASLGSSIQSELEGDLIEGLESAQEKFFFTVWRTSSTTATVTTYSTNRSVTISISIACTYPGILYNVC